MAVDLLFAIGLVSTGRWGVSPVLSGSMRPVYPPGGVIVSQQVPVKAIRAGDVIIFHPPGHPNELVAHRVIATDPDPLGLGVVTKGDANNAPDPWGEVKLRGDHAYRARFGIPLVGYAAVALHSRTGRTAVLVIGAALFLFTAWSLVRSRAGA